MVELRIHRVSSDLNICRSLTSPFNDFADAIPKGIGKLTCLKHLNLSYAGFGWQVPFEISTLTRLASLDISSPFGTTLSLEHPNLEMLVHNLTELRELNLDGINITFSHEKRKWSHNESPHLPNLTSFSMAECSLHSPLPKSFWQLHSLSILRLDHNNLSMVAVSDLFTNFPSLTTLTLYNCSLKGSIPSTLFEGVSNLIHLVTSPNIFLLSHHCCILSLVTTNLMALFNPTTFKAFSISHCLLSLAIACQ